MLRKIALSSLIAFSASSVCLAKNINLYDQPQNNAKVIGTIDSSVGVVPIFSSKAGDWMKVGDPRNGNVGWIKSSDLSSTNSGFSFTEKVVNSGKGPQQYIVQFGTPKPMTSEQSAALFKQIQTQQAAIQKDMQRMLQDIYYNADAGWGSVPIIMPVVITPQSQPELKKPELKK